MRKALSEFLRWIGLRWLADWFEPEDGGGPKPVR